MPEQDGNTHPRSIDREAFWVTGLSARTSNTVEMSGSGGQIGPLWNAFLQLDPQAIPGVSDPHTVFSVYTRYESDHNGPYSVILGRPVKPGSPVPEGMTQVQISAASYLVFPARDRSPDAIRAAWKDVYGYFAAKGERAFTADFEQYGANGVELFIAVR